MSQHYSVILDATKRAYCSETEKISLTDKLTKESAIKFNMGLVYFTILSFLIIKLVV
jgi:hypothetical protein